MKVTEGTARSYRSSVPSGSAFSPFDNYLPVYFFYLCIVVWLPLLIVGFIVGAGLQRTFNDTHDNLLKNL